jgi:hypothetical protein
MPIGLNYCAATKTEASEFVKQVAQKGAGVKRYFAGLASLAVLLAVSGAAVAQDQYADPPSRVARIAYLTGSVSFEPASLDEWGDATLNYPMTTGDGLYADEGARAVLRIGQNSLRLNSGTDFQFVNLTDSVVQTSINAGSVSLRVRHLYDGESWEVDTPNGAITLLRPGEYRVDTDSSRNATMITVRTGDIEVTANDQSFPIHSGQTAYIDDSGNPPDVQDANTPDDFDSFVSVRDRMEDVPPPQYVSPDMVGYEDLNANGDWSNTPDYGPVWTPRVAAGWTPYHQGHWAWVDPWGWTWVDDEPWGFAPFHYGRWAYVGNRWGWCPGPVSPRAYYAPALVAFVGGVSVGGGGGVVGWFPLGPREAYYPSYHVSQNYVRQVNVTNTRITNINVTNINVTNITYVNRNAIVAMPQNSFASAQPVQRAAVRVDANQMRQAQVIGAAPKVAPQRESVLAAGNGRKASAPPASMTSRPVVAKLAPPPPAVSFAAKQQMLQQHPGTPVAPAQLQSLRTQAARNPAPGRMQIQAINTKQVHPVTPAVHHGPAPTFAQRPAQTPARPAQPPARNAPAQSAPAAHPQAAPAAHAQPQPPAHQPPPVHAQTPPPAHQPPATHEQTQAPTHPTPPAHDERQTPPREAPPAHEHAEPPAHQAPPAHEQAPPAHPKAQPAPPPAPKPPPQKKEEKKPDEKKPEEKKPDQGSQ